MSSVGSTSGPLSASAIVSPVVGSGSHILRIEGYSGTRGLGKGRHINSETFAVGGHSWRLCYYPDSFSSYNHSAWIAIALNLVDHQPDNGEVEASFRISLLDRYGDPVPSYCRSNRHTFENFLVPDYDLFNFPTVTENAWSGVDLIERSDLEKSAYLMDDAFSVRCDVTVVKKAFTKSLPVSEVVRGVVKHER